MKLIFYIIIIGEFLPNFLSAQSEYGSAIGNYLTTSSVLLNPASASRMKAQWMLSPVTINTSFYNNAISLNMPFSPYRLINQSVPEQYKNSTGGLAFDYNWIKVNTGQSKLFANNVNRIQGPSVLIKQKGWVWGVRQEFITHTRLYGIQTKWINEQIENLASKDTVNNKQIDGFSLNDQHDIYFTHHRFNTINLLLSKSIKLRKNQELTFGITYKLISPLSGYHFSFKTNDFILNNIDNDYAKINLVSYYQRYPQFSPKGWGAIDLGSQWIYQKPLSKRKPSYKYFYPEYQFKIGFSLLDLGNLVYRRTIINQMTIAGNFNQLNLDELKQSPSMSSQNAISQHFKSLFQVETKYGEKQTVGLPSKMTLNVDLQLYKNLFANGLVVLNLRNNNKLQHMSNNGFLQADIRYETRHFELGLPLFWMPNKTNINTGLHLRFFHFYVGTNHLKSHFKVAHMSESSLYIGFELSNYVGRFIKRKWTYLKRKKKSCFVF